MTHTREWYRDYKREQKKLYKLRYPEKRKETRRKYLDNRFRKNPELMEGLKGRLRNDFGRLTRLMFDEVLPRRCYVCGAIEDLQIHHMRYVFPIQEADLVRLCRRCHLAEHWKVTPLTVKREATIAHGEMGFMQKGDILFSVFTRPRNWGVLIVTR